MGTPRVGPIPQALEDAVQRWAAREAGPEWTVISIANATCSDGSEVVTVWPAMRLGRVVDDDVVGLRIQGGAVIERFDVRRREDVAARCRDLRLARGASGLPASEFGPELVRRVRDAQLAIQRGDAEALRHATWMFAQLVDDDAVLGNGVPDALGDLVRDDIQIEAARVEGRELVLAFRRRGVHREERAPLTLGPNGSVWVQLR